MSTKRVALIPKASQGCHIRKIRTIAVRCCEWRLAAMSNFSRRPVRPLTYQVTNLFNIHVSAGRIDALVADPRIGLEGA
jgi:hypothetical protein